MTTETTFATLLEDARKAGAAHGKAAASWYFDGNTSDETYSLVVAGIDDGDPAVLDTFPSSPLSGEWADDPTPASVLEDLGVSEDDDGADDLLSAYEDGFYEASADEIERVARLQTQPVEMWVVVEDGVDDPPEFLTYAEAVAFLNDRCAEFEADGVEVEYGLASSGNFAAARIAGRWIAVEREEG